jgi:novobiocin biosynthesis protein NovU/D-mycarose 3-C-methyltransferase
MGCRICGGQAREILDLGEMPPANSLKTSPEQFEESFPLVLQFCDACGNVQLRDCLDSEALYRNYLYLTPRSAMLADHYQYLYQYLSSNAYLQSTSTVVEVGSNVGLFLEYLKPKVKRVIGIDPAVTISELANQAGIETISDFFDSKSACELKKRVGNPDIILARHCFAHNCDPHQILAGVTDLLDDEGHFVIENAYLLNTIENNEFDQIYHEHMFYYSIRSMQHVLGLHDMHVVDVLMSLVHGGSIIFVAKKNTPTDTVSESVAKYLSRERLFLNPEAFDRFAAQTQDTRRKIRALIQELKAARRSIYTYGATAKGNTLINFVGLTTDDITFCVDSTPIKQGRFLPKSNIKIVSEEEARSRPPDYYLLTAWNYKDEIISKVRRDGNYRSKFIVPIPFVHIL